MGQREKLTNNVVATETSGNPMGSSKTGVAYRSCPKLRKEARPFNPLSASLWPQVASRRGYIPWVRQFSVAESNS